MKKITLNLLKGLLVIVLFTGVSVALSTTGVQTVSEAKAGPGNGIGAAGSGQGITSTSINQYLVNHAYTNIQSLSVYSSTSSSTTWKAIAINASGVKVSVFVYTQSTQILGNNEVAI